MSTFTASPGVDSINTQIHLASDHAASGDTIVLPAGTYTFTTYPFMFDKGFFRAPTHSRD